MKCIRACVVIWSTYYNVHMAGVLLCFALFWHCLTHWGRVAHVMSSDNALYIVSWTIRNRLLWNFHRNQYIFIKGNAFETVVLKMSAIFATDYRYRLITHSMQLLSMASHQLLYTNMYIGMVEKSLSYVWGQIMHLFISIVVLKAAIVISVVHLFLHPSHALVFLTGCFCFVLFWSRVHEAV